MSDTALTPGRTADGRVNVRLANPLNPRDLERLGVAPDTSAGVNDVIQVGLNEALGLISAGYVQVDPDDQQAVAAYLDADASAVAVPEDVEPEIENKIGETDPERQPIVTPTPETVNPFADLRGAALDEALEERDLSKSGTVDEKRQRLADYVPNPVEPAADPA